MWQPSRHKNSASRTKARLERSRRSALKKLAAAVALPALVQGLRQNGIFVDLARGDAEAIDRGDRTPFLLTMHMGSICGIASGLCQPAVRDTWQTGLFRRGQTIGANNPLLNKHTEAGAHIFTDYTKTLAEIQEHLCLVNGIATSLDHNVARRLQSTGSDLQFATPEWAAAVTQNSKTAESAHPLLISSGTKTFSVNDITLMASDSLDDFRTATTDAPSVPKGASQIFQSLTAASFSSSLLSGVKPSSEARQDFEKQSQILLHGLQELEAYREEIATLESALSDVEFNKLKSQLEDAPNIAVNEAMRKKLILAGALAITGLAHGMSIVEGGHDLHNGGADVASARYAGAWWIFVTLFWKWVKTKNLQDDVMIMTSHDFGRSPYNGNNAKDQRLTVGGETQTIEAPGRDHAPYFGMMFLNGRVPPASRIGNIADNFVALAGTDRKGGTDPEGNAFRAVDAMGSFLMRVYPEIFPTERIVRKHWPDFREIKIITGA